MRKHFKRFRIGLTALAAVLISLTLANLFPKVFIVLIGLLVIYIAGLFIEAMGEGDGGDI